MTIEIAKGQKSGAKGDKMTEKQDPTKQHESVDLESGPFAGAFAEALNRHGNLLLERGEYDGAILHYSKAIRVKPDYTSAYFNRGRAYYAKKEFDRAIDDYSNAIRLNPNYSGTFHNRALARKALKDFEGAIEDYTKVVEFKPDDPNALMNRGYAYEENGDFSFAIEDCNKAIRLNEHLPEPFVLRSRLRGKMNDKEGELADSRAAVEAYELRSRSQPGAQ
jgi:tetratricopeptide (TPR) repeat protein